MQFAAVDVIQVDGELKIIEVNAGICMEHISQFSDEGRRQALKVYSHAVECIFGLEKKR